MIEGIAVKWIVFNLSALHDIPSFLYVDAEIWDNKKSCK